MIGTKKKLLWGFVITLMLLVLYLLLIIFVRLHNEGYPQNRAYVTSHHCQVSVYVALTPSEEVYYGTWAKASAHTSCPFANRIFGASVKFIIRHGGSGDGAFYTRAYSPATHLNYRLRCEADGNINRSNGMHVDCRGVNGIRLTYTTGG